MTVALGPQATAIEIIAEIRYNEGIRPYKPKKPVIISNKYLKQEKLFSFFYESLKDKYGLPYISADNESGINSSLKPLNKLSFVNRHFWGISRYPLDEINTAPVIFKYFKTTVRLESLRINQQLSLVTDNGEIVTLRRLTLSDMTAVPVEKDK